MFRNNQYALPRHTLLLCFTIVNVFFQPYIDAPPYIGIALTVNGIRIPENGLVLRHQLNGERLQKLSRPKDNRAKTTDQTDCKTKSQKEPLSENTAEGCGRNENRDRTNTQHRDVVVVKIKEKSLTLNFSNKKSDQKFFPAQTRSLGNSTKNREKFSKRSGSVEEFEVEEKQDGTMRKQLRLVNVNTSIKTAQTKKTYEINRSKSASRLKFKKLGVTRAGQQYVGGKLRPRIIAIPDVGVPRTVLRYTDRRVRRTKKITTGMEPGAKIRQDTEVVK